MKTNFLLVAVLFAAFGFTSCKSNEPKVNSEESLLDAPIESTELMEMEDEFNEDLLTYSNIIMEIDSPDVETETPNDEEEEEEDDFEDENDQD